MLSAFFLIRPGLVGVVYALGGYDGSSHLNLVEAYNVAARRWFSLPPMHYRRSALGAVVLDGRIYVSGGYDGKSSLRTCEAYDPDQNRSVITCTGISF
ncbi:unnamed protein product [Protopolystoma xenopodis]|uniref:Kelch repeat protein n=1 Tax=Protopolystoma xenopodis TaxID=117903 RepID=A0A3S4ZUM5_9PLAT|nr:unnamed protein product [Protopolystoma xenopodis]